MEQFLVFRCNLDDQWKLQYFMIALGCDMPIIESLFYTTMGFYAWPGEKKIAFIHSCIETLKQRIELHLKTTLELDFEDDVFYGCDPIGQHAVTLSWNGNDNENDNENDTLHLVWIYFGMPSSRLNLFFKDWTRGKLQISVETKKIQSLQHFRFGQINAMLDAHLKLLFDQ